jgi:aminopeptidase 2
VSAIFDAISYSKGASVIHMLASWMGEPVFQAGMRHYVRKHAWGNASTDDLWASLGEASGIPVALMMEAWTRTTGFPFVTVTSGDSPGAPLRLTQQRFLAVPSDPPPSGDAARLQPRWMLPLRALTDGGAMDNGADLLTEHEATLAPPPGAAWLKLNGGQTAFYRVRYDSARLWAPLVAALPRLPAADRVGLISDAFALAAAGESPTTDALELLAALGQWGQERDYCVWAAACAGLSALSSAFYEAPCGAALRLFGARLLAPLAAAAGWDERLQEGHLQALLRTLALAKAGELGDPATLAEARRRFAVFAAGNADALPPGARAAAFRALLLHGDEAHVAVAGGATY